VNPGVFLFFSGVAIFLAVCAGAVYQFLGLIGLTLWLAWCVASVAFWCGRVGSDK